MVCSKIKEKPKQQNRQENKKSHKSILSTFTNFCTPSFASMAAAIPHAYGRVYVRNLPKAWQNEDTKQWVQSKHLPEPADVAMFHKPRADCASAYITWMKATTGQLQTFCEQLRVDWLTHKQVEAVLALDVSSPNPGLGDNKGLNPTTLHLCNKGFLLKKL